MDIETAVATSSRDFDLTDKGSQLRLTQLADELLEEPSCTPQALSHAARAKDCPLEFQLAAKLIESRRAILAIDRPLKVGVVFAMWGERARLQERSGDNPNGEDALRVKLDQLDWVSRGSTVDWSLYAVDDGDPADSGAVAAAAASTHELGDKCKILWLNDALPARDGPLRRLLSVDDSRKGGAVIHGASCAIADGMDAIMYTDADNSVHLGQLGLLLKPFTDGGKVVIGNRKHPDSVLVKAADRWGGGIKTLRHIQRMIGQAIFSKGLTDTQAAFKLFDAALLADIIKTPTVFDFSFDTDWLAAVIARNIEFSQVPFAFIDSESESASAKQNPMTTWETLLFGMLRSLRRHDLLITPDSQAMANVLDAEVRDYKDLELLLDKVPEQLNDAGEAEFGDPSVMSPAAMRRWIQHCCRAVPLRAESHTTQQARLGSGR